ncbi:serine-aspartate repeat-containing protein C [Frankliniella occidentalis]|uniref:Serine-aspartate repeat-containing protein C n=1 Tax=Frankliniella occidentalis TaxID=133901 RepID=A0A6J1T8S3_FRAOC|nr:serine-aspartate repeat-containing protein C [Frankliniella occidentalis]
MRTEIVQLQSGGEKLLLDGQSFYHRLRRNNRRYWKCSARQCSATVVTTNTDRHIEVEKETPHNHKVEPRGEYESEGRDSSLRLDEDEDVTREPLDFSSDGSDGTAETTDESDDSECADVLWMEWVEESSDDETSEEEDADHASDQNMSNGNESNDEVETDTEGEETCAKMDTDDDSETDADDDSDSTNREEDEFDRSIRILSDHEKILREKCTSIVC